MTDHPPLPEKRVDAHGYWKANRRLLAILLLVWAGVSLGLSILFVEPMNQIRVAGFPLGFWFAQQGSIYAFVLIIVVYARAMDRLDAAHEVN